MKDGIRPGSGVDGLSIAGGRVRKLSDAALVDRARNGCSEALEALFERSMPAVDFALRQVLDDPHDVAETLQEAAACALERLAEYQSEKAAFATWFRTIARYKAIDRRRRSARAEVMRPETIAAIRGAGAEHLIEDRYFSSEFALPEVVGILPLGQKMAVFLNYAGGYTRPEIAAMVDRSVAAVRQAEHRGIQTLRARMRPEDRVSAESVDRNPMVLRVRYSPVVAARQAFAF